MSEETKDELLRLREENEKLRAQVERLKECIGLATLCATFPNIQKEELMELGKSMKQHVEFEKFLADLLRTLFS